MDKGEVRAFYSSRQTAFPIAPALPLSAPPTSPCLLGRTYTLSEMSIHHLEIKTLPGPVTVVQRQRQKRKHAIADLVSVHIPFTF
jgi:hypothetical protein